MQILEESLEEHPQPSLEECQEKSFKGTPFGNRQGTPHGFLLVFFKNSSRICSDDYLEISARIPIKISFWDSFRSTYQVSQAFPDGIFAVFAFRSLPRISGIFPAGIS